MWIKRYDCDHIISSQNGHQQVLLTPRLLIPSVESAWKQSFFKRKLFPGYQRGVFLLETPTLGLEAIKKLIAFTKGWPDKILECHIDECSAKEPPHKVDEIIFIYK